MYTSKLESDNVHTKAHTYIFIATDNLIYLNNIFY